MCTVSLIARRNGYALAMNRDEKLSRVAGLPPARQTVAGHAALSPSEPGGGTWIALNDFGVTLALINWYSVPGQTRRGNVSRGSVIRAAQTAGSADEVEHALRALPLRRINPFRLIGVFPGSREVWEWRWNLKQLKAHRHPWRMGQWVSSGWDEPAAQRIRGRVFRQARRKKSAGTLAWLRRLHRSHVPGCGAGSICMHRADATTVSYTEVVLTFTHARMRHHQGAPCVPGRLSTLQLPASRSGTNGQRRQSPGAAVVRRRSVPAVAQ